MDSNNCKRVINNRFSVRGRRGFCMHKETKEYEHLSLILSALVNKGQSNTVLILGPPGSGKTSFLDAALFELNSKSLRIINIEGIFCKDLKSSISAICQVLEIEDKLSALINNSANFDEKLGEILGFLRTSLTSASSKNPILIILDNVEIFCEQQGQALLYNLFDIVQSKESPLCVIGLTSHVEILELFEKRVKSRFSHRVLQLPSLDFQKYFSFASSLLTIQNEPKAKKWNDRVIEIFSKKSIEREFHRIYDYDSTISPLSQILYKILMSSRNNELNEKDFLTVFSDAKISSRVKQAENLSLPELFMLAAVNRFMKNSKKSFEFSDIYQFIEKAAATYGIRQNTLFQALKNLNDYGFISNYNMRGCEKLFFQSELTLKEFEDIFKAQKELPTVFQSILAS